ncbi:unnamed protein product [Mytilus coruscus]|uniref:Integrase zinc-binding domain-containing protein n=1 Tax=Mytilus coruscus TaxID=42192 RepID=A0A6J8EER7_MYTCO|nr:unnamed protein product [Mytilus coruscus]
MKIFDQINKRDNTVLGDKDKVLKDRFIEGIKEPHLTREVKRFSREHITMKFLEFRQEVLLWVNENTQSWKVKLQMQDVEVVSNQAIKSEHTSKDNSEILNLLTKQQEMLEKQQQQIDRLSNMSIVKTYSDSTNNYGHKRPECPSAFQAQSSDEDTQKTHTRGQFRGRGRGYRGRYNQRCNRYQGRGAVVPSDSEEVKRVALLRQKDKNEKYCAVVQSLQGNQGSLPRNIMIVDSYAEISQGTVPVRMINIGFEDVWINQKTRVGTLHSASLIHEVSQDNIDIDIDQTQINVQMKKIDIAACKQATTNTTVFYTEKKNEIECGECKQLVIPETLKHYVLETLQNLSGHQGTERTLALLHKRCYWSDMVNDVKHWIKTCERCLVAKNPLPKVRPPMGSLIARKPLDILAMDFTVLEKFNLQMVEKTF